MEQVTATIEMTKVPKKVFVLNTIQLLGILAAALAMPSPETQALLAILPEVLAGHIGKIAIALLAAKPGFNIIADFYDNGKLDGSWKSNRVFLFVFFLLPVFLLSSCQSLSVTPSGNCQLATWDKDGKTFGFGPCFAPNGAIGAYRTEWSNGAGTRVRATYDLATNRTVFEYRTPAGLWVKWSADSGISLDGRPPEVNYQA